MVCASLRYLSFHFFTTSQRTRDVSLLSQVSPLHTTSRSISVIAETRWYHTTQDASNGRHRLESKSVSKDQWVEILLQDPRYA